MGALHEGHASLIRSAAEISILSQRAHKKPTCCLVSIFVNPTQFNDPKDLARYPRTLEADLALCKSAGASAVYSPSAEDIYPPGQTIETPPLPPVATQPGLEDAHRPGHFAGVAQVVLRLFRLTLPWAAIFGEKDWQQLRLISEMTLTHHPSSHIISADTIREPDGLAMSSRNRFLADSDRATALSLSRALRAAAEAPTPDAAEQTMRQVLDKAGASTEYAVIRDAGTLLRPAPDQPPPDHWRALIAARVGSVRLIDNAAWAPRSIP